MRSSPAFKFYPSDFWGSPDVQAMDLHEAGAYMSLLSAAWLSDRPGCLKDEDEKLRRWARMTREQWTESRNLLLSKFPIIEEGWRGNPRLLREGQRQEAYSASQSAKGSLGGRPKAGAKPELSNYEPGLSVGISPEKPSVSVSVSKNKNTDEPAALSLVTKVQKQADGRLIQSTAEDVESIWNLWPNKGGKKAGLKAIREALRYLRANGYEDPAAELTKRVQTWLGWHTRQAKAGFAPAIGFAQGWFGDIRQRYLDPAAQPPAPALLKLPDGRIMTEIETAADGWKVIRGDL